MSSLSSRPHGSTSLSDRYLRGLTTVSFYADDPTAARAWYTELLVMEPYFVRSVAGSPAYIEFRMATTSTNSASSTAGSPDRTGRATPRTR